MTFDQLISSAAASKASDIHLRAGHPPLVRINGELQRWQSVAALTPAHLEAIAQRLLPPGIYLGQGRGAAAPTPDATAQTEGRLEVDVAWQASESVRVRASVFRQRGTVAISMRLIPDRIPSVEELGLPPAVVRLAELRRGLVVVTGITGSGKSTTLAALIDVINRTRPCHILTIEDPIEFVHPRKNCLVSQREIGSHSPSFAQALHSALREDPDVILVGELRDYETMSIAVTAAEMGILVMGTLHTNGAAATVDRMVNAFPADKQSHVRAMLSTSLRGVISQQLIPRAGKPGRVAALEILVNTPAVANLIRQGKLDQLENTMQSGAQYGMRLMDSAIQELLEKGIISGKEAYKKAINKAKFEQYKDIG